MRMSRTATAARGFSEDGLLDRVAITAGIVPDCCDFAVPFG
jgi:hypothetical protein